MRAGKEEPADRIKPRKYGAMKARGRRKEGCHMECC